jgi:hypothetical protein
MSMNTREGALTPEPTDNLILDFEAAFKSSLSFARSLELLLNTVERQTRSRLGAPVRSGPDQAPAGPADWQAEAVDRQRIHNFGPRSK